MTFEDGALARVLARARLPIRSPLSGALSGRPGPTAPRGEDFDSTTAWQDGDDLRLVEWKATARTATLQVRRFQSPARAYVSLIVDPSRGMWMGTGMSKYSTACQVAGAVSYLARRDGQLLEHIDASTGYALPGWAPEQAPREVPQPQATRQRGLVVIISDFRPRARLEGLLAHTHASEVLAVEVRDLAEMVPPEAGVVRVKAPSGMGEVLVNTSDKSWREEFAHQASSDRKELEDSLRSKGAHHIVVHNNPLALLDFAQGLELLP